MHRRFKVLRGRRRCSARGAAVVEMAIVAPLLLTLVFGIIEFGWVFMAYQTITNAAREGARTAVLQGSLADGSDVEARVNEYIDPVGLGPYTLQIVSSMASATGEGLFLKRSDDTANPKDPTETVRLTVPYSAVSLLGVLPAGSFDLSSTCSMRKEGFAD